MTGTTLRAACYLGRRYNTAAGARESRAAAVDGATVTSQCDRCEGWHVIGGTVTVSAARTTRYRPQPHQSAEDQAIRLLVLERDDYCCVCCGQSILDRPHSLGHRLRAGQGGPFTPVNLLTFMGWGNGLTGDDDHHRRIDTRRNPMDEVNGYTIRARPRRDPATVSVLVVRSSGERAEMWPTRDGQWVDYPPAEAVA